jgi:hypothetical protein
MMLLILGSEPIDLFVEPISVPENNQLPADGAIMPSLTAELVASLVEVFGLNRTHGPFSTGDIGGR